jgi:hypothetical protein
MAEFTQLIQKTPIFGYIKEHFNIRPNKHRSPTNFFASLFAALIAYQIKPSKPKIAYP